MKDVLKMVKFDYVISKGSLPVVIIFLTVCLIMSVFGIAFGVIAAFAPVLIFAQKQIEENADFRRIYGILPVKRSTVITADFAEMIVPLLIGEIIGLVFFYISRVCKLYTLLPEKAENVVRNFTFDDKKGLELNKDIVFIAIIAFTGYLCLLVAFLKMRMIARDYALPIPEIIVSLVGIELIGGIAVRFCIKHDYQLKLFFSSFHLWHNLLIAFIANVLIIASVVMICRHTIKIADEREL